MATHTILLDVAGGSPPSADAALLKHTSDNEAYLAFENTTDKLMRWTFRMPDNYVGTLTCIAQYRMASATTGNIAFRTRVKAVAPGENWGSATFSAVEASTDDAVPGTAGLLAEHSDALATPTVAAGDMITFEFGRENAAASNATGDMEVPSITLTYSDA